MTIIEFPWPKRNFNYHINMMIHMTLKKLYAIDLLYYWDFNRLVFVRVRLVYF